MGRVMLHILVQVSLSAAESVVKGGCRLPLNITGPCPWIENVIIWIGQLKIASKTNYIVDNHICTVEA
jgi:hypothetical protein